MPLMLDESVDHVELNSRREALEQQVILICPTISWWKGMYVLPRNSTETTTDGAVVDKDDITTPQVKLVTDNYPNDRAGNPWKKKFRKLESRLDALKEKYSVPFPIKGVRIVPKSRGIAMMDEMYGLTLGRLRKRLERLQENGQPGEIADCERQLAEAERLEGVSANPNTPVFDNSKPADSQSIAYELHVAAKEFCNNWDNIRAEIARKNKLWSQVESRVPNSAGLMLSKFSLDVVPVELAGGFNNSQRLTQSDLEEHEAIVQDACRRRVEEAIESMIAGPRQQLAEALEDLHKLISRDGRVTQRSFIPVHAAIAKIRAFDFVANSELLERMNQLEQRLNSTQPIGLDRITAANNGFAAALEGFMAEVQNAERQAADLEMFGREFRAIDLG